MPLFLQELERIWGNVEDLITPVIKVLIAVLGYVVKELTEKKFAPLFEDAIGPNEQMLRAIRVPLVK